MCYLSGNSLFVLGVENKRNPTRKQQPLALRFPSSTVFPARPTPALPCGPFEGQTTDPYALPGARGHVPLNRLAELGNMDSQDGQDYQDQKLPLRKRRVPVRILRDRQADGIPRERGRPARTKPDAASTISPTCIHRERRRGSPSAWALPFPTTGRLPAASQGNSAAAKGTACGRDARAPRGCPNWRSASRRRRWGRPRSQGMPSRRVTSQKAGRRPLGNSRLPAGSAPTPGPRGSLESETTDYGGLSGGRTLWGEAGRRPNILFIPSIHVNQGLTHAGGRDQTPGTSTRDLDVKWCPS